MFIVTAQSTNQLVYEGGSESSVIGIITLLIDMLIAALYLN